MKDRKILSFSLIISIFFVINIYSKDSAIKNNKHPELQKKIKKSSKYFNNGKKFLKHNNYDSAEKEFNKVLLIMNNHGASQFHLAQIYYLKKNFTDASISIQNAKKNFDVTNNTNINTIKNNIISLNEIISKLSRSLSRIGYNCKTSGEYGSVINDLKTSIYDKKQLKKKFESKLKNISNSSMPIPTEYYYLHGNILFKQKIYKEAKDQYLLAIKADPFNEMAYNNLINMCLIESKFTEANRYKKRALQTEVKINKKLISIINKNINSNENLLYRKNFAKINNYKKIINKLKYGENEFTQNCYIVFDKETKDAVIIDPGAQNINIETFINTNKLKIKAILNTHGHFDHIRGNKYYSDLFKVKVYGHLNDMNFYTKEDKINVPDFFFKVEGLIPFGSVKVYIYNTPGHSPGSVCFLINNHLFAGDSLFKEGIGKTYGNADKKKKLITKLIKNIKAKLLNLPDETYVFPGHGDYTTIGYEKKVNLFLK